MMLAQGSRFFKPIMGVSPRGHREGAARKNMPRDASFASLAPSGEAKMPFANGTGGMEYRW